MIDVWIDILTDNEILKKYISYVEKITDSKITIELKGLGTFLVIKSTSEKVRHTLVVEIQYKAFEKIAYSDFSGNSYLTTDKCRLKRWISYKTIELLRTIVIQH